MLYRHFFWDFDGTLYDTYGRLTRAAGHALEDFGCVQPFEKIYAAAKRSLRNVYTTFLSDTGIGLDDFIRHYNACAEIEGPESMRPYAGVREMLSGICRQGGRNYLYTHRGLTALEAFERDGFTPFFTDAVTAEDHFPSKPAPDALNYLIEKHRLDKSACIMLGDRDIDLDAGKNAGIACALFDPDGFYPDYDVPFRCTDFKTMAGLLL